MLHAAPAFAVFTEVAIILQPASAHPRDIASLKAGGFLVRDFGGGDKHSSPLARKSDHPVHATEDHGFALGERQSQSAHVASAGVHGTQACPGLVVTWRVPR